MIDLQVLQQLAPNGVLRAAINFGNPVLAQRRGYGISCKPGLPSSGG